MKKFTKITLIIAAVFAMAGIMLCCIASTMAGGMNQIRTLLESGDLNYGKWNFKNGVTYGDEDIIEFIESVNVDVDLLPGGSESDESVYTQEIKHIEMDLDLADVVIRAVDAEELTISMENGYAKYYTEELEGDTLVVTYKVGVNNFKNGPEITIDVPADYILEGINIDTDLGNVEIRDFEQGLERIEISADLGNIELHNCVISHSCILEADMGNVQMTKASCEDAELHSDMGEVSFEGTINGNLTLTSDMGKAYAKVDGKEEDYSVDLSADMGEVKCNGAQYSKDLGGEYNHKISGAKGTITMHSSMGEVELVFTK